MPGWKTMKSLSTSRLELAVGERVHRLIVWGNRYDSEPTYTLSIEFDRVSKDEMQLELLTPSQFIDLHSTTLHIGGVRWWFSCSGCGRRCAKLYLPRYSVSVFLCRICHDLTYASCQESKAHIMELSALLALSVAEV